MKRVLLAALVTGTLAVSAPGASANHDYDKAGGCSFASATDAVAGQGQQTGEIDIEAIVYSATPGDNPLSATITCYITVNGAAQPGATVSASGTVAVVGAGVITYTSASVADDVQLCERIEYHGKAGDLVVEYCYPAITIEIPPQIVWDLIDGASCPVLQELAGTYTIGGSTVYINDQGDVYVDGVPQWDCPPYDVIWP